MKYDRTYDMAFISGSDKIKGWFSENDLLDQLIAESEKGKGFLNGKKMSESQLKKYSEKIYRYRDYKVRELIERYINVMGDICFSLSDKLGNIIP